MTQGIDKSKILVLIICVGGLPRNQNIGTYISQHSESFDIRFVVAVEPKHIDSGISLDIEPLEILINTSKLRIVTLVKSPWSSWKKYRSLEVAKFPPPCASCYLINEATARYALEFAPLGVADWPQWAHKVKFFYDERFHVPIITSDSYIDDLRSKTLSTHNKYLIFTKTPLNSQIKKIWQIRYLVLYRALWKLDTYFSKRSEKAFFKKVRKIW